MVYFHWFCDLVAVKEGAQKKKKLQNKPKTKTKNLLPSSNKRWNADVEPSSKDIWKSLNLFLSSLHFVGVFPWRQKASSEQIILPAKSAPAFYMEHVRSERNLAKTPSIILLDNF